MKNYPSVIGAVADHITIIEQNGIKVVRITHPKANADISLHGGHLLSFKPTGQKELLWLSEKAEFDTSKAIRGGIPICWPWFGHISTPSHGFARISQWHLVEHRETEHGVIICLGLEENETTLPLWPFAFQARLYIEISESLKVTLEVSNTDNKAWSFTGALHTYLNVADIRKSITTGMGPKYSDSLQAGKVCQGDTELQLTDTVDRVYTQAESAIEINDPENNRTIVIKNQGHNAAVIWNPWENGAKTISDMTDDGYNTMLCVESAYHAVSQEKGKTLQPDESYQLVTELLIK